MKTTRAHFQSAIAAAPSCAAGRALRAGRDGQGTARPALPCQAAFTMIEIALALGVIGFALVAIIGILPAGMNVQRETHQDMTISQDGTFFLEAIRNGGPALGPGTSTSLDFLTNYVESITVGGVPYNNPNSGQMILGLLSTPTAPGNFNTARIRGLTGAATEQNGSNTVTAFRYKMDVEIIPFATPSPASVEGNTQYFNSESNYLARNLYELRLKFSWPVLNTVTGRVGPGRQAFRSLVSGSLRPYTNGAPTLWFFQPNIYTNL
jgi:type II secretory pathway pseudopilin PulG